MPLPAYGDLSKAANDLINKDFYHTQAGMLHLPANLEVKLKAPNGANVTVKGKQAFDGATTASLEGKYTLKPQGITVTQGWTTAALLDTKVEFASLMSQPVKAEFQNLFNPNAPSKAAQKLNLTFKQPNLHARAFLDHSAAGNINALIDATVGHEGFVAGAEAGYDVSKAAITRYSAGLGYQAPTFTASLIAMQNLSVLAASYYQKVNSNVEAGAKATYDLQGGKSVGLEVASKYKLDPLSFAKAKINDRGIAALAYNTKLNAGTTFGVGLSLDTNKLNEAGHKIGTSFVFEG
ncbi:outer mitochondrial membrane porin protein [Aureobasidium melanogenum CBS 110374]|uniref:Outer mitochondrial membrane porin protein n=1 Tax=Aureobasidium melanogenum (strain CBS 110374) TaxID=1043003 RepID=A0A074VUJ1_AURM1|nr:outer mitochondrial membrane porin protein [Aureobasidium melanogenum CBS 110374]KEQ62919.1 outer mitochondrial membrane porin protein [Aureobasidium melanogenum CBS 110374]